MESSQSNFFERHPLVSIALVIVLFPLVLAVGTVLGAKWLVDNGHKKAAVALVVVGSLAAVAASIWWIANSGSEDEPATPSRVSTTERPTAMAWLSPDGTGLNCAWYPGVASDYSDPFVFCDYAAP